MKKTFKGILFALMAIISINAFAQEEKYCEFYFKDFTIKPGETKTIQLYLKNNFLGHDFQMQLYFPEGITPVPVNPEYPQLGYFEPTGRGAGMLAPTYSSAYEPTKKRLRVLTANMYGASVFTPGDAPIANVKVTASADFNSKQLCKVENDPELTETGVSIFSCKLNYDKINDDGSKTFISVEQQNFRKFAAYPAVTIPWLLANGVEGGEYGIADPVAVVAEAGIGSFVQDAARTPLKVKAAGNLNVAGCPAESLMGTYNVVNGNPCLTTSDNMAAPEEDLTVTAAVKKTTLDNVLFNPEANEVVEFAGYMRTSDNTVCAYKGPGDQGQCITVDWSALPAGTDIPTDGSMFVVTGPVQQKMIWADAEKTPGMTGKEGPGAWKNYILYPVAVNTNLPTGVTDVYAKTVTGVKYVNVAGMESNTPFDGVNIMVTTYTDGTHSAVKVIK